MASSFSVRSSIEPFLYLRCMKPLVKEEDRREKRANLRKRHIGDFQNWKNHDDYQKAFERLLRDLQAGRGDRLALLRGRAIL